MKKLIKALIVISTLAVITPSFAMWHCQSTNARESGFWGWHAYLYTNAQNGALNVCRNASVTLNPNTCRIVQCWQQ